jgi:hypothetical protein
MFQGRWKTPRSPGWGKLIRLPACVADFFLSFSVMKTERTAAQTPRRLISYVPQLEYQHQLSQRQAAMTA